MGVINATISVIAASFILIRLRLKSGSVWTAYLFHVSRNNSAQDLFTPLTTDIGVTRYIIGEFGARYRWY
jgi:hypothetical protein